MPLLSPEDFPAIRASLDVELDAADLPDAIIALDSYQGAGEAAVLALDPDAATRDGDAGRAVIRAAIAATAALLAPVVALRTREQLPDYSYQREVASWQERAAALRERARAEVAGYLGAGGGGSAATRRAASFFGVARAAR